MIPSPMSSCPLKWCYCSSRMIRQWRTRTPGHMATIIARHTPNFRLKNIPHCYGNDHFSSFPVSRSREASAEGVVMCFRSPALSSLSCFALLSWEVRHATWNTDSLHNNLSWPQPLCLIVMEYTSVVMEINVVLTSEHLNITIHRDTCWHTPQRPWDPWW